MQWNGDTNAGFSTARTTWLPVAPGYRARNAAAETRDPGSLLNFYKALIHLRKTEAALQSGDFALLNETDKNVLAFARRAKDGTTVLVALNFTATPQTTSFQAKSGQAVTLLSSFGAAGQLVSLGHLVLPGYGAFVGRVR